MVRPQQVLAAGRRARRRRGDRAMFDDGGALAWWATRELGRASLGDARLSQRLVKWVSALSQQPTTSIPPACGSWADTKAGPGSLIMTA